jgi:hypothetical protein
MGVVAGRWAFFEDGYYARLTRRAFRVLRKFGR